MSIEVNPDWWKTLFDDVYLTTDARSVCNDDLTRREVDVFCELVPFRKTDRILDLCGGHGRHSLELCRRGFACCTVFDYSDKLLERGRQGASEKHYAVSFVQGDARGTGLADGSFDRVMILGNSLGYVPDVEADLQILIEGFRLLTPDGWLLLDLTDGRQVKAHFSPNAWHEIEPNVVVCRQREIKEDMICAREMVLSKDTGIIRDKAYCVRLYEPDAITALVRRAGYRDVHVHLGFRPHCGKGDFGFMNQRMLVTARKRQAHL